MGYGWVGERVREGGRGGGMKGGRECYISGGGGAGIGDRFCEGDRVDVLV